MNITKINNINNATTIFVARKLGLKSGGGRQNKGEEPWQKRQSVDEIRKLINNLEQQMRGKKVDRMKSSEIETR